jgi:hypothetical protein
LRRHLGEQYLAPPHNRALLAIFRTPRIYDGSQILVDPFSGRRVNVSDVIASLQDYDNLSKSYRQANEQYNSTTGD